MPARRPSAKTGSRVRAETAEGEVVDETTPRIPTKRFADPDGIGRVAVFLASDLSSDMTGSQVAVDGGLLLT
jgi:2-dehydro-3-deoxy-D-gluconate 5-dehydrogenase